MRRWLSEAGEIFIGVLWWAGVWVWGAFLTTALVLAPLLLANLVVEIRGDVPPTVALLAGVTGAYVLGLPPWNGDEPEHLPLVIGGAAVTVVAWDLLRGSANVGILLLTLGVTVIAWPIRRTIDTWLDRRRAIRGA